LKVSENYLIQLEYDIKIKSSHNSLYYLSRTDSIINYIDENKKNNNGKKILFCLFLFSSANMSSLFFDCEKLSSLPDISKWKTNNVTNMSSIFIGCFKLLSLPDISKWNTNNVNDMSYMFSGCSKLLKLPDISKWNEY